MKEILVELISTTLIASLYVGLLYAWYKWFFKGKSLMSFAKSRLLPFVLIAGFVLYLIGYFEAGKHSFNFAIVGLALYSTARLLILGNDMVEIKDIFHSPEIQADGNLLFGDSHQLYLELLHLCISLILATVVFIFVLIFIRFIANTLKNRRLIRKSNATENYIFFSATTAAISLVKEILKDSTRKKDSLILFIEGFLNDEEKILVKQLEAEGVILVGDESLLDRFDLKNEELMISLGLHVHDVKKKYATDEGNFFARHQLKDCVMKRKTHFFFFSEEEEKNVKLAKGIMDELNDIVPSENQKKDFILYVRTLMQDYLEDEYNKLVLSPGDGIELRYINDALIAARKLVKENPPVKYVSPITEKALAGEDFTPLLLGFGRIGQSVLRKLTEMGTFLGNTFRPIVVDENMSSLLGRFDNRFPGLSKNYNIQFWHQSVGEKTVYEYLTQNPEYLRYVVISMGSDELNMLVGLEIMNLAKRLNKPYSIFVHINDESRYDQLFKADIDEDINLNVFGRMDCIYNYADIIDNTIYKQAQKIHEMYMNHSDPKRQVKAWNTLDRIKKLSNISVMEHLQTKCVLAGFSEQKIMQMDSESEFVEALGKERLLNLTMGEHIRWNAHYFANGWDTLPLEEVGPDDNKIPERRLHGCLVSWDELDAVSAKSYDVKIYDELNVISIWERIKTYH